MYRVAAKLEMIILRESVTTKTAIHSCGSRIYTEKEKL
jgi:hypothetical protein